MDIYYFNTQIKDELDGATSYIQRAIREKKEHPSWGALYLKMGLAELDHAATLVKIFEDEYKITVAKSNTPIPYLSDVRKSILDMYTEFAAKIKYLQEMFENM